MTRHDRGLTLIELLAAMAILAVVSLMAVQTLSGALFQRDILTRADAQGADLIRALALLRRDLEAVAPVPLGLTEDGPLPAVIATPDGFSLMRAGLGDGTGTVGRVVWRLDAAGLLSRQVTVPGDEGPAVPVLADLRELRLTALGGTLPGTGETAALPPGFALSFTHARHGALRLVVAR